MKNFLLDMVKSIVGKGENAGYQHFLLIPQYFFQKSLFQGLLKVGIVSLEVSMHLIRIKMNMLFEVKISKNITVQNYISLHVN